MDFSEKWGQDDDEAVKLALKDLNCTVDDVDVVVLEEPSKGFLGLGSKLAKVRVTRKAASVKETKEAAPAARPAPQAQPQQQRRDSRPDNRQDRRPDSRQE